MKCLLLNDLQIDFLPLSILETAGSETLPDLVNTILHFFDSTVATRFWHPADHISFAANHLWRRPGQVIVQDEIPLTLQHIYGVQNSFGAEWMMGIKTEKIDAIFDKGVLLDVPPHSGFFDRHQRRDTGLLAFLKKQKVDTLYLMGIDFNDSLSNTALDGVRGGFQVKIIEDACRGKRVEAWKMENKLQMEGIELISMNCLPREL